MELKIRTDEAIAFAGNKNRLADLLDITRQAVNNWGEFVPDTSSYKLHYKTSYRLGSRADAQAIIQVSR